MDCRVCKNPIGDASRFCSFCGQPTAGPATEVTHERPTEQISEPLAVQSGDRRFRPGQVLASRYRIIERVGRGGMGEVYHAEDLTLEQPVALKFLPEEISRNPDANKRFRDEVRVSRQISHPNVCRVHDIGEVGGRAVISMEYIRGEDLRSLLARIGRLSPDKALEIAIELASGLAAAHDKGVLHRDLKPANVMLDERGDVHITDFGLAAAIGEVETRDIRSGTPAYMAPEQRAGEAVTKRSDVFSLGLVLYEIFTGKRAYEQGTDEKLVPPSKLVEGLELAVERVILQCLEIDPLRRPPSAAAVRDALPGGDPLAVAVARGETPAPALVAEAGAFTGLSPAVAWTCLIGVVVLMAGVLWLDAPTRLMALVPLPKSPELLMADARSILESLDYPTPQRDTTYGFTRDIGYIDHLMAGERSSEWWELLARGEPSVLRFWYRESPEFLVPQRNTEFFPQERDPPLSVPGMVTLELDTRGRLRRLEAVPFTVDDDGGSATELDWIVLFTAAGLEISDFAVVEPEGFPPSYADRRAAWEGTYPDAPEISIRVEASSLAGRAVGFRIVEPWTAPPASRSGGRPEDFVPDVWGRWAHVALHFLLLVALGLVAGRNLKLGRGDRKLAFRLASVLFVLVMLHWLFGAHHVSSSDQLHVFLGGLYRGFFAASLAWLFYIALEPYARRLWPQTLISWVRLLDGRFRDPRVGRDVLVGCVFGTLSALVLHLPRVVSRWLGGPPLRPDLPRHPAELDALRGVSESIAEVSSVSVNIATFVLFYFVALLFLRFLFRKTWIAIAIHGVLQFVVYVSAWPGGIFSQPFWIASWFWVYFRFGWVSIFVGMVIIDMLSGYPLTTNLSSWHAYATILPVSLCLALALYGFKVSLGGKAIFQDLLAES